MQMLPREEFLKTLPKKRMGVGVILFNQRGEILVVKPVYKDHWSTPGGVVDANESPRAACEREIQEEIGLTIHTLTFIGVDYVSPENGKEDNLQFVFCGNTLPDEQIAAIRTPKDEIEEYRFVSKDTALTMVSKNGSRRLRKIFSAIENGVPFYLEDQK